MSELRVFASNALKGALQELQPQLEKATAHRVAFLFEAGSELKARIDRGEAFDVAILSGALADDLANAGEIDPATRATIARVGAGVAIRQGARKPDLSSAESLKRELLNATSVAVVGAGNTGGYMRRVFEKLGIADEMKAKTQVLVGVSASEIVARGEAELGFTQQSEIFGVPGAEVAGPLPPELQVYTPFDGAISVDARNAAAARRFIELMTSPAAAP